MNKVPSHVLDSLDGCIPQLAQLSLIYHRNCVSMEDCVTNSKFFSFSHPLRAASSMMEPDISSLETFHILRAKGIFDSKDFQSSSIESLFQFHTWNFSFQFIHSMCWEIPFCFQFKTHFYEIPLRFVDFQFEFKSHRRAMKCTTEVKGKLQVANSIDQVLTGVNEIKSMRSEKEHEHDQNCENEWNFFCR